MYYKILTLLAATMFGIGSAYAQEVGAGAGRIEIGAFPGGAIVFMQSADGNEPSFGNYALGASLAVNVNRWVGFEGDGGGTIGERLACGRTTATLSYTRAAAIDRWFLMGPLGSVA
jgi:hypothetical protein